MKKTIWMPLVLGGLLGLLDFACWAGDFVIPLGPYGVTGPQEVFIAMSATLGRPLGLFVTCLIHELGNYVFSLKSLFSPEQYSTAATLYAAADFSAHLLAALSVVYGYKFLHLLAKKLYVFFASWNLILATYYLLLVSLQFLLIGSVIDLPPLFVLFKNFLPELLVVAIITTLIWIAMPVRYTRPLWIKVKQTPDKTI